MVEGKRKKTTLILLHYFMIKKRTWGNASIDDVVYAFEYDITCGSHIYVDVHIDQFFKSISLKLYFGCFDHDFVWAQSDKSLFSPIFHEEGEKNVFI